MTISRKKSRNHKKKLHCFLISTDRITNIMQRFLRVMTEIGIFWREIFHIKKLRVYEMWISISILKKGKHSENWKGKIELILSWIWEAKRVGSSAFEFERYSFCLEISIRVFRFFQKWRLILILFIFQLHDLSDLNWERLLWIFEIKTGTCLFLSFQIFFLIFREFPFSSNKFKQEKMVSKIL